MTDTSNEPEGEIIQGHAEPRSIHSRAELLDLANRLGVRTDWHEPDEQELTATVHGLLFGESQKVTVTAHGVSFDNAGFWPLTDANRFTSPEEISGQSRHGLPSETADHTPPHAEMYVTLHQDGRPVAHINLALLFAWATFLER